MSNVAVTVVSPTVNVGKEYPAAVKLNVAVGLTTLLPPSAKRVLASG